MEQHRKTSTLLLRNTWRDVCSALGKRYSPHCYLRDKSSSNKLVHVFRSISVWQISGKAIVGVGAHLPLSDLEKTGMNVRNDRRHLCMLEHMSITSMLPVTQT